MKINPKTAAEQQNAITRLIVGVRDPKENVDLLEPNAESARILDALDVPSALHPLVVSVAALTGDVVGVGTAAVGAQIRDAVALVLRVATEDGIVRGGVNNAAQVLLLRREGY